MTIRDTILDLHGKGAIVDEIAAYLRMSKYRVQQIITHGGYPWQSWPQADYEKARVKGVLRLHNEGKTVQEIGRKWRVAKATVQHIIETGQFPSTRSTQQPSPSLSAPSVNGELPWLPSLSRSVNLCALI